MDSLGSDALTGMEVTPLHAENRKLLRKVARQEKKLEKYVKKIEGESASKLKELEFLINKQHFVEEKHSNLMQMFKDNQMQFIYDMDARLADESQVHADKQQLEQHKDDKLPHWIGSFDAINTVIKANGHSNRLRWRSKTVAKIIHCVNEIMAGEPPKEQFDDVNRRTGCDEEIRNGVSDDVAYELDRAEVVASLEATIAAVVAATSPVPTNSVAADLEQSLQNQRQQELQGTELDEERIASAEFVAEDDISACLSSCGSNSVSSVAPATGTDGGNNLSNINGDNATPQLDGRGLQVRRILERFVLEINLTNANVMLKQFAQLRKMIRERYFNTEPIYGYSNNDDFNDVTISGLLQDYEEDLEAHSVVTYAGTHDTTPSPSVAMSEQHYDDDWTAVQRQRRDVRRTDQVRHLNLTLADKRRERRENESSKDRRFNTSGVIKSKIRKTASGGTLTSPHKNSRRVNSLDGSEDDDYDRSSNTSPAGTSPGRLRKQTRKFIPISTNSGMNTGATSQSQSLSGSPLTTRKNSAAEAQRQQSGRFSYHRKSSVDADMELMCNPLDMRQNITQSGGDSGTSSIVPSVHDTDNDDDGNENRSNSGDCDAGSGHIGAYGHNDDHSYISAVSVGSNANSYNTLSTLNDKSRAGTLATKEVDFLNGQYTLHGVKHNTTTSADLGDKMKTFTDKVATDTKIAPDTRALIQLRSAAKNGDFRHAWSVFRKSYDPPMKPKPKKEKKRDLTGYSVIGHNSPNLFDDSDMPVDHLSAEEKEALAALQKGGDWEEDLDVERSEEDKAALSRIRQAVKNSRSNSPSTGGSIGGPPGSINTESSEQARFNRHVTTADLTSFPEKSRSTLLDSKLINGKVNGMNNSSSGIKMSNTMSQLDNTLSKLKGESPKPKSKKVLAQMNEWSRWPNIKPKEKKLPTPGKPPISMLVFKLLMIAFKNAPVIDFRNACEVMDTLALYPELSPDVTLFNVMMSACIRDSRWRRCMAIYTDMTTIHHLLPTSQTFEIIIDSCRHSLDSPSTIYEVLRKDYKLPHEFCYKVASVNAGNHISNQALRQAVYESTHHAESTCEEIERKMLIEQERLNRVYGHSSGSNSGPSGKTHQRRGHGNGKQQEMSGGLDGSGLYNGLNNSSMFTASTTSYNSYTTESTNLSNAHHSNRSPTHSPMHNASHIMTTDGSYGGTGRTYTDLSTNNSAKEIYNPNPNYVNTYYDPHAGNNTMYNDNISVLSIVSGTDILGTDAQPGCQTFDSSSDIHRYDLNNDDYTRSPSPTVGAVGNNRRGGDSTSPCASIGDEYRSNSSPPGSYRSRSTRTQSIEELPTLGQLLEMQQSEQLRHSQQQQPPTHAQSQSSSVSGGYSPVRSMSPLIPNFVAGSAAGNLKQQASQQQKKKGNGSPPVAYGGAVQQTLVLPITENKKPVDITAQSLSQQHKGQSRNDLNKLKASSNSNNNSNSNSNHRQSTSYHGVNPQKQFRKQQQQRQAMSASADGGSIGDGADPDSEKQRRQTERQWRRVTSSMKTLLPSISTTTYPTPGYKDRDPQVTSGFNTALIKRVNQPSIRKIYQDTDTRFSTDMIASVGSRVHSNVQSRIGSGPESVSRTGSCRHIATRIDRQRSDDASVASRGDGGSNHGSVISISDHFTVVPGMIDSILPDTLPAAALSGHNSNNNSSKDLGGRQSPTMSVKSNDTAVSSVNTKHTIYSAQKDKRPGSLKDSIGARDKTLHVINPYTTYTAQSHQPSQKALP